MSYIKLDDVTEEHLIGAWVVKNRQANSSNVGQLFARCNCLKFQKNNSFATTTQDGKRNKGNWQIVREREVIYNPQVRFNIGKNQLINSIITNLMEEDETHLKLILYFDSGVELVLEKEKGKDVCRKSK